MQRTIALAIAFVSITSAVYAKPPATSFTDLRTRLDIGETVVVTTRSGTIIKGAVQDIYETILMIRSGPNDLSLAAGDVERISIPSHATRGMMLLGLVGGFAAGAAIGAAKGRCRENCFLDFTAVDAFIGGGLGGLTGLVIGGAIGESLPHENVVFQRSPTLTPIEPRVQDGVGVATNWPEVQTAEHERRWLGRAELRSRIGAAAPVTVSEGAPLPAHVDRPSPRFFIGLAAAPVVAAACAANLSSPRLSAPSLERVGAGSLEERRPSR